MRLIYGPYEPDKPAFLSEGLQLASNVYPGSIGYRPVGQFVSLASPMPSKPLGAAAFVSPSGVTTVIAGTGSALYRFALTGWTELSSGYALVDDDRWRFAQFGGLAIATNGIDPMVKIDLDTFATAPLGGTPPTMKMLSVVKDFLVGGVINGTVNAVEWSAINNAEGYTVGLDQCDYQILPAGGEVTGILGGEFGIILQRGRVVRMTYVGDNLVFQFDEVSNNIGCVSPHSVVQSGQMGFWLSDNGFVMWDGATIKQIGQERVDRLFSASYNKGSWGKMSTAVDQVNNLVTWAMADRMFIYNWLLDKWSVVDLATSIVFSGFSRSLSLEDVGALYPRLEDVPYSLDDPRWRGGDPKLFVFDSSFQLGTLSGSAMAAMLETGDLELAQGREARLAMARPISDAISGTTLTIGTRARLGDALANTSYSSLTSSGDIPVREAGRYTRFSHSIAAGTDWSFLQGLDLTPARGAKR